MEAPIPKTDPRHPLNLFKIHHILAHSYSVYLLLFLIGTILDVVFNWQIFFGRLPVVAGLVLLVFATLIIIWAQHTSRNLGKTDISKETFCRGPYCYTRSPTHWGLFLLMFGFGLVSNAFFITLFAIIAFLITRFSFLRKQEEALAAKYGNPYLEYKKSVKL